MKKKLAVSALLALAACSQQTPPAAPEAPAVQLYTMDCGRILTSDAGGFADDGAYNGQAAELVDPCYLIRHPNGDLMWDVGFPEGLADTPEGIDRGPMHFTVPVKLTAQLAQLNLTPADIEFMSFSHSHVDHIGNGLLFANATWIVDADERAYMFREEARAAEEFPLYAALENFNTALIEGDSDHDVFGDGSVVIIQTPGHTPGHTILRVNLRNAGVVLLTGDMWHLAQSREARRVPTFNTDRAQTLASMDKIEALAAETSARVVRQHVPEDFEAMPVFPAALD